MPGGEEKVLAGAEVVTTLTAVAQAVVRTL